MYNNLTFNTAGELSNRLGINNGNVSNALSLSTYANKDDIQISAAQQKIQWILQLVPFEKILFTDFDAEEINMISKIAYTNNGTVSLVNKRISTATPKREDGTLRFQDSLEGHIATLHGMLRWLFATYTPNDTILGHAHNIFTTLLYSMVISTFRKNYEILELPEENRAAIRYACACISASKHFELNCDINDVAVPITTLMFNRVMPSYYQTNNNITTYAAMSEYLKEKAQLTNMDKLTFITSIMMRLGQRALIILESGIDMLIDCMLSKATTRMISRNLYKMLLSNYENLNKKVIQSFYQQIALNITAAEGDAQ